MMITPSQREILTESGFDEWFIELLHKQQNCIQRDVLRDKKVKEAIKLSWVKHVVEGK